MDKEADRERKRRQRAEKKAQREAQEAGSVPKAEKGDPKSEKGDPGAKTPKQGGVDSPKDGKATAGAVEGRPDMEDAQRAMGDMAKEDALAAAIMRRYNKSSCWAFVMYEDSAPPDYEDKLRMLGVQFALSPWHDKDVDGKHKNGKPKYKKKHRHGILHWPGGTTTYKTAAGISRDVLHGTIPIPLVSPRGYYRYFCHLDNPKKAQYDEADIIVGNGFDVGDFLELTAKEKNELCKHIVMDVVIPLEIVEYWDLVTYTMLNGSAAEFEFVRTNTLFFQSALRSRRHINERGRMGGHAYEPLPKGDAGE